MKVTMKSQGLMTPDCFLNLFVAPERAVRQFNQVMTAMIGKMIEQKESICDVLQHWEKFQEKSVKRITEASVEFPFSRILSRHGRRGHQHHVRGHRHRRWIPPFLSRRSQDMFWKH